MFVSIFSSYFNEVEDLGNEQRFVGNEVVSDAIRFD